MHPVAYRLAFVPTDQNLCPEECLPIYCYDTLREAVTAAFRDCIAQAISHAAHGEGAEASAYERCADHLAGMIGEDEYASISQPVTVTAGDNPRTIGAYVVRTIRIGAWDDCSTCGDFRGIVTDILPGGNVIACCEECEIDAQRGIRRNH